VIVVGAGFGGMTCGAAREARACCAAGEEQPAGGKAMVISKNGFTYDVAGDQRAGAQQPLQVLREPGVEIASNSFPGTRDLLMLLAGFEASNDPAGRNKTLRLLEWRKTAEGDLVLADGAAAPAESASSTISPRSGSRRRARWRGADVSARAANGVFAGAVRRAPRPGDRTPRDCSRRPYAAAADRSVDGSTPTPPKRTAGRVVYCKGCRDRGQRGALPSAPIRRLPALIGEQRRLQITVSCRFRAT
jgi:hypothetical protein